MNTFVTTDLVMKEVGRTLTNTLKFSANVQRSYDGQYRMGGAKVGWTVNARLPQRYVVNRGAALNPQATTDNVVPISLTDQTNIGIEFGMASLKLEIDDYTNRYVEPAVETLANDCDFAGLSRMYKGTYYTVGTPAVVPGSSGTLPQAANDVYLLAGTKLTEVAVPMHPRKAMLTAAMHAQLVSANSTVFNPAATISKQYKTGQFGDGALAIDDWFMDENIGTHTVGALGGTPLVNGATAEGATSLVTDGWTAAAAQRLNVGDVFQVAGVFAINPQSRQSTGRLMDFVVTAPGVSDGSGNMTISFAPSMRTSASGPFDTINALPADNAAITIFGSASAHANKVTRQALVYHPDAYALVMADLDVPGGVWVGQRISNKALGIAVRFIKDYDIMTDQSPGRLDLLFGWKEVRPEMAVRICS